MKSYTFLFRNYLFVTLLTLKNKILSIIYFGIPTPLHLKYIRISSRLLQSNAHIYMHNILNLS